MSILLLLLSLLLFLITLTMFLYIPGPYCIVYAQIIILIINNV